MKKKILFWIESGTIMIFGAAKYLQNDINAEFFAIYDVTAKPKKFFQEQKLVNFQKSWFYHDFIQKKATNPDLNYLKEFEKKYGINLLKLALNERIFLFNEFYKFSTDEIISILEQECKFFENVIEEVKPDFVIMVTPYFHHNEIFFQLCKVKGIKVLELNLTRFPNRATIGFSDKKENYKNFEISGRVRSFKELQEYRKRCSSLKTGGDYWEENFSNKAFLTTGLDYIFSNNENIRTHYTYYGRNKIPVLINYVSDFFRKRNRKKFIDRCLLKKFTEDKKFLLYTLQVEHEVGILLEAPFFLNQAELIKNIAKSMPVDHLLLVKEHPACYLRSWREINTYKELAKIPGVVLIHPDADSQELIKKSSLVLSITSSSALDAIFLKKPVIVFTDTNFSMIPDVHRLKEIEKLPEAIKSELDRKINPEHIEKYVQFIENNSFEYNLMSHSQEMGKFLYNGERLVDIEISENNMQEYLTKTESRFIKLKNEYLKNIEN